MNFSEKKRVPSLFIYLRSSNNIQKSKKFNDPIVRNQCCRQQSNGWKDQSLWSPINWWKPDNYSCMLCKHVKYELPIKLVSSYCLKNFSLLRLFEKHNNLFQPSVAISVETIYFIWTVNQRTGFYIKCNTRLKWIKFLYFLQ